MTQYEKIADRIHAHLKRFEKDPQINRPVTYSNPACWCPEPTSIRVMYVSKLGSLPLKRCEAEAYLAWLDAGNVGQHFKTPREVANG